MTLFRNECVDWRRMSIISEGFQRRMELGEEHRRRKDGREADDEAETTADEELWRVQEDILLGDQMQISTTSI